MTRARNISRILSAQEISGDINLSGIVTATEFYGDGSNLTGIENAVTQNVSTSGLNVSGMTTLGNATAGVATANQFSGNITGTAATFSGNVTVGGVLTYDDVTNVDSLGIITARSGVSIADSIFHTGDTNTAIRFPAADTFTVETAGAETLRITSGGDVGIGTNNPGTTLEVFTDDDTDISGNTGTNNTNSILRLFNKNGSDGTGVNNYTGIRFDVANGARSSAYLNYVRTGDNQGAFLFKARNGSSSYPELLRITSAGLVGIGSATPTFTADILSGVQNTGANINNPSQLSVTGPNKSLTAGGANVFINSNSDLAADTGGSIAFSGRNTTSSTNSVVHATIKGAKENATSTNGNSYLAFAVQNHSAGALVERMRITSTGGLSLNNGELIERVKITAGKLSDNTNIDLENGNVHHFTTQETTTSTPNIRVNSSTSLNSVMAIGDTISVTLITTAAAGGYSAQLTIDGSAVTEKWNGGSAPSAGGSSGNDVITYQIIKTADATYTVLGNVSNFA